MANFGQQGSLPRSHPSVQLVRPREVHPRATPRRRQVGQPDVRAARNPHRIDRSRAVTNKLALVIPASGEPRAREPGYWRYIIEALEESLPVVEVFQPRLRARFSWYSPAHRRRQMLFTLPLGFLRQVWRSDSAVFVCVEYGPATLATLVASRILRHRRVLIFQEHRGNAGAELTLLRKAWRKMLARVASGVIANTRAAHTEAVVTLGCNPRQVYFVPLLVPPLRAAMLQLPSAVDQPKHRPLFLFAGRLIPLKNVGVILSASRLLASEGLSFEIWIVGDGPERQRLLGQRDALELTETIRFCGAVDHRSLGFLYQVCDVFIMPTFSDYRSVAVLEAMRFGKPIIDSTGDGNAGAFVEPGVNGLVFDPSKPEALADCMRSFIADASLARLLGGRGAKMVEALTPATAAEALIAVLSG